MAQIDICPDCGAEIDKNETEYIEKKKKFTFPIIPELNMIKSNRSTMQKYEELHHKLNNITGLDLEKLIDLFAAGYTLQPPKITNFADLTKENKPMLKHHLTKYFINGSLVASSWIQLNIFGKSFCFSKKIIYMDSYM